MASGVGTKFASPSSVCSYMMCVDGYPTRGVMSKLEFRCANGARVDPSFLSSVNNPCTVFDASCVSEYTIGDIFNYIDQTKNIFNYIDHFFILFL